MLAKPGSSSPAPWKQIKWKQNVEVITVKKWHHLNRCHMEIIFSPSKSNIKSLFKGLREKLFPHLAIWYWWLPQSCSWDITVCNCPRCGKKWEVYLNAVLYSRTSEWLQTEFTTSHHQLAHSAAAVARNLFPSVGFRSYTVTKCWLLGKNDTGHCSLTAFSVLVNDFGTMAL